MIWLFTVALALPMYAQRSARTCANCHVSPTLEDPEGWNNPELMARKCTMTCLSCHTDPTGGGLRNSSGRYFAASTVAILPTQDRSYSDHDRELLSTNLVWKWMNKHKSAPKGEDRTIPSNFEEAQAGIGEGQTGNLAATGHAGPPTEMSFWDGRYGSLNADPVFQVGGDARAAYYTGTKSFFPMQLDLHTAVHPVHHLTLSATAAAQPLAPEEDQGAPVFMRRAFAMIHELPGMAWAKAGAFQPAFGTFLDDHTSPARTLFEVSAAESANTVIGAEVGLAPNYPFAQASVFMNDASILGAKADSGWGAAVQGGYRDLAWSLTGHAQIRQRNQLGRGDLLAAGVAWSLSPKFTWDHIPVTWLGEITAGRRTQTNLVSAPVVFMSEMSFLLKNGVVAKYRTDIWMDAFASEVVNQRHGLGLSVAPVPGITFEGTGRLLAVPSGQVGADALFQTHLWF